ncbi:MAG: hypothetical protein IJ176_09140 [Prevotella sp.]|nr:hypothetical protein [Prevotella sp.]
MKSKIFFLMLLVAAIATGCSKDDDDNGTPGQETATGATMSVTVVFAPGQLGDMGFADNVLEGVYRLKVLDHQAQPDTIDVNYLAGADLDAAKEMMEDWFDNGYNIYTAKPYERRLLVLTEPFMVDWMEPLKERFLDIDEVLVLKMNQDDVAKAAARLGLGSRLHGLNISAASSARRYCQYIRQTIEEAEENHQAEIESGEASDDDPDYKPLNCDNMCYFRLYEPDKVALRDSVYEVLKEELGGRTEIVFNFMATTVGDGIYTGEEQNSILQEAYKYGQLLSDLYTEERSRFHFADLGSAAQGLGYYFMGRQSDVDVLSLDTQLASQWWVRRDFGTALFNWTAQWMRSDAIATMPASQVFGGWNSNYVTDNIQLLEE